MRDEAMVIDETPSQRVLIGCVTPYDPVSDLGERPIATAARALRPDRVDLIYSESTREALQKTERFLWMECGIQDRHPWFVDIDYPFHLADVADPLINVLVDIQKSIGDPDAEYHIVESATSQLRVVLLLAAVSRVITAQLWHVDQPPEGGATAALDTERRAAEAEARLTQVDLSRFQGAAIRSFRDVRLRLQVQNPGTADEAIHAEVVPEHWLDRDPHGNPMKLLLELAKARTGEAYAVRQVGGWLQVSRLTLPGLSASARSQAIQSLNNEAHARGLNDDSGEPLIAVRGSTRSRQYRLSPKPHQLLIERC